MYLKQERQAILFFLFTFDYLSGYATNIYGKYQEIMSFGEAQLSVDGGKEVVQHPRQRSRLHLGRDAPADVDLAILRLLVTTLFTGGNAQHVMSAEPVLI